MNTEPASFAPLLGVVVRNTYCDVRAQGRGWDAQKLRVSKNSRCVAQRALNILCYVSMTYNSGADLNFDNQNIFEN
jgi:hypothetical protein